MAFEKLTQIALIKSKGFGRHPGLREPGRSSAHALHMVASSLSGLVRCSRLILTQSGHRANRLNSLTIWSGTIFSHARRPHNTPGRLTFGGFSILSPADQYRIRAAQFRAKADEEPRNWPPSTSIWPKATFVSLNKPIATSDWTSPTSQARRRSRRPNNQRRNFITLTVSYPHSEHSKVRRS